jgi:hypothetical protein
MGVELRSREVLLTWAAFCMVHAATGNNYTILRGYGVSLRWQDLRHLVLSDRAACDALLAVAAYLQEHTKPGRGVFTLSDGGAATIEMARGYARCDAELAGLLEKEKAAAAERKAKHWQEVTRKKAEAASFRRQLHREQAAVDAAQRAYDDAHANLFTKLVSSDRVTKCQEALSAAKIAHASTRSALLRSLAPPSPVIQPLPKGSDEALSWLFFMHMPPMFR